ncbi:MAG: hypothetical protein M5U34_14005 [Chloroflexi bacterium]|nr:hypothetical protein [Chloroflexota bacterium]
MTSPLTDNICGASVGTAVGASVGTAVASSVGSAVGGRRWVVRERPLEQGSVFHFHHKQPKPLPK